MNSHAAAVQQPRRTVPDSSQSPRHKQSMPREKDTDREEQSQYSYIRLKSVLDYCTSQITSPQDCWYLSTKIIA